MAKMTHLCGVVLALATLSASAAEKALPAGPEGTRPAKDRRGRFIGWHLGIEKNPITIIPPGLDKHRLGAPVAATALAHDYSPRNVTTLAQWKPVRADIRQRVLKFLEPMPPSNLPLDAKVESTKDKGDYTLRRVSVAFTKTERGQIGLVIPKGLPTPAPALIMYGAYGCGIDKSTEDVYSRAYGVHLARLGMVVAVLDHWYEKYEKHGEGAIMPLAASIHMGRRTVDYFLTQKDLVNPKQIVVYGHVYGAEIAPFLTGLDDRIAGCATSSSSDEVIQRTMPYWPGPVWMGRSRGLGCIQRYSPRMFVGARRYDLGATHGEGNREAAKVPFLSQEHRALMAPRPYLSMQENTQLLDSLRPVYALYDKPGPVQAITHKWKTNLSIVAQEYMMDFFLTNVCGITPGKAPEKVVKEILAGIKSSDAGKQLRAARLAGWWKPKLAAEGLDRLIGSKDPAVRAAAAKALGRVGDMKRLVKHIRHADPTVRLAVVEAMHVHGDEDVFEVLAEHETDKDKWVHEAKCQTMNLVD